MREVTSKNFGLLIAFLLPGFTALWGASYFSESIQAWLGGSTSDAPTIGGFLYLTLASVAAGLTVSTVRWAVIDTIHQLTGLARPNWDFSKLQNNVAAYEILNEIHYKYYLHYANMVIALLFVFGARRLAFGFLPESYGGIDLAILLLVAIFFVGSRDALCKYNTRVSESLGTK